MRIELFGFDCVPMKLFPVFREERRIKVVLRRSSGFEEDAKRLPAPINTSICQFGYKRFFFKKNDNNCYPNAKNVNASKR